MCCRTTACTCISIQCLQHAVAAPTCWTSLLCDKGLTKHLLCQGLDVNRLAHVHSSLKSVLECTQSSTTSKNLRFQNHLHLYFLLLHEKLLYCATHQAKLNTATTTHMTSTSLVQKSCTRSAYVSLHWDSFCLSGPKLTQLQTFPWMCRKWHGRKNRLAKALATVQEIHLHTSSFSSFILAAASTTGNILATTIGDTVREV